MEQSKFYTFNQNNSGGSFYVSEKDGISEYVIIEAFNADHANKKAEEIGLYFNGCDNEIDCSCCGDRWHEASEHNATSLPEIYGKPVEEAKKGMFRENVSVHYLDGTFKNVKLKT